MRAALLALAAAVLALMGAPGAQAAVGPFSLSATSTRSQGYRATVTVYDSGPTVAVAITLSRRVRTVTRTQDWVFSLPPATFRVDPSDLDVRIAGRLGRYGAIDLFLDGEGEVGTLPRGCRGPRPVRAAGSFAGSLRLNTRSRQGIIRFTGFTGVASGQSASGTVTCRTRPLPPCPEPAGSLRLVADLPIPTRPRDRLRVSVARRGADGQLRRTITLVESGLPKPLVARSRTVATTLAPEAVAIADDLSDVRLTLAEADATGTLALDPAAVTTDTTVGCGDTAIPARQRVGAVTGTVAQRFDGLGVVTVPDGTPGGSAIVRRVSTG